ncbi:hypothetical protein THAOC_08105, partial [Thalassiosira oceanica]
MDALAFRHGQPGQPPPPCLRRLRPPDTIQNDVIVALVEVALPTATAILDGPVFEDRTSRSAGCEDINCTTDSRPQLNLGFHCVSGSMPKPKSTMARVDFLFGGILVWSLVSTTLLIHQFHDNTRLQEQLAASQRATT